MSLNAESQKILGYIRDGRNTTACFADNLGIPAPIANRIAEDLEQNGYIRRVSYLGINRFNWLLTDKGVAELPPLSESEARLLNEASINLSQYKILVYTNSNPQALVGAICSKMELDPQEIVSNLSLLVDQKLLKETGLVRRRLSITEKGAEVVRRFSQVIEI